ncbi:hypothetical protein NQ317_005332 [Molorchus minor]|uniref:Retinoblastoma-associated protein A-box domain-containing protein n=1 Tax=Molorchus minor TaxID=1323400 RepID=A0ABQ9JDZ3_9CUCU|nr:hypothetical protein NQ317_005332 [Molorchus minor]
MLIDRSTSPSKTLIKLFEIMWDKPSAKVEYILKTMGNKFTTAYVSDNPNSEEEGKKQLQIGITLFYKFIENVLQNEKKLHDDISGLLDKEVFYHCMFACCLEIVLFSYNSSKKFPWLLDILNIEPFQFVKVIELIVRLKDQLSREVIKHLNKIEETVIESLAWKSNSKIWSAIYLSENVPKFEETALPGHILYIQQSTNTNDQNEISDASMMQISATESFQSPIKQTTSNMQLQPVIQAGQSVLQKNIHLNKNGSEKLTSVIDSEQPAQQKKKFYNLAGMRMEHLCTKLGLTNTELKQKIWTVFEESIRNTDLIKDRHLDQLLMCAVYIICKVSGGSLKFQDIMKFYREQPQSAVMEKIESAVQLKPGLKSCSFITIINGDKACI